VPPRSNPESRLGNTLPARVQIRVGGLVLIVKQYLKEKQGPTTLLAKEGAGRKTPVMEPKRRVDKEKIRSKVSGLASDRLSWGAAGGFMSFCQYTLCVW
jgi:hypothetical protein